MRRLKLYLHTTSDTKFAHLQYLFGLYGVRLSRAYTFRQAYPELQGDAKDSLKAGVAYLRDRFSAPFIIEDTEVKVAAYSQRFPYPGYDLKRWWQTTSFEEIDLRCRKAGTRAAASLSHVCLSLPNLPSVYFSAKVEGTIAEEPGLRSLDANTPWLNTQDFGAIFVPEGADKVFGLMSIQESLKYDFRHLCVKRVVKKIEEIESILNLDPACYMQDGIEEQNDLQLPLI